MCTFLDYGKVGDVHDPRKQISMEWKIKNYLSLSQRVDTIFESPTFHFANASWCLRFFPNGERKRETTGWMGLYLVMESQDNVYVTYKLGIKSSKNEVYHQSEVYQHHFHRRRKLHGQSKFFQRSLAMTHFKDRIFSKGGALTVFCTVVNSLCGANSPSERSTHANKNPLQNSAKNSPTVRRFSILDESFPPLDNLFPVFDDDFPQDEDISSLCQDFQHLLNSEEKADVTFCVKNQSFRAHKLILGTRSSVLAAMFEHEMKENVSGKVNIEDCEPEVFKEFLLFLYTGELDKLSSENASELFVLSDKYDLNDLKKICARFMKDNLSLDKICEVITLADRHNEENLKAAAKMLIVQNFKTLIPTEQWTFFMANNPLLASELLLSIVPHKN